MSTNWIQFNQFLNKPQRTNRYNINNQRPESCLYDKLINTGCYDVRDCVDYAKRSCGINDFKNLTAYCDRSGAGVGVCKFNGSGRLP